VSVRSCVLVVEDDASVRQLVRTRLDMANYDVHVASNGNEALSQILRLRPDAMILDINMPEMDGFAVLEALRAQREMPRPATMVLTARHAEEDVRRALMLGAKDYLTKPFSEAQLLARVARLLRPPLGRTAPDLVIV
jgi:two-component system OmpR family response regulator